MKRHQSSVRAQLSVEVLEGRLLPATSILGQLPTAPEQTISTVPPNGDQNPYGMAFVPQGFQGAGGVLHTGDLLVSNFNNSDNTQGTGTTIVRITPAGQQSVFFHGPPHATGGTGLGLTTALGVLASGFVIVGNVPTSDGTAATIQQGSLLVINSSGKKVETLASLKFLNGPWDMAVQNYTSFFSQVFVSDLLSGTVTRFDVVTLPGNNPLFLDPVQIASGYKHEPNGPAVFVGPTGLAFDLFHDVLYVASTDDNAVFAIPNAAIRQSDAGTGKLIYQDNVHLHGPLGLVLAPNGDLITANGDAVNTDNNQLSELVEFTPTGHFVTQFQVDPANGSAFGLALQVSGNTLRFAAVDDGMNMADIWTLPNPTPHEAASAAVGGDAIAAAFASLESGHKHSGL